MHNDKTRDGTVGKALALLDQIAAVGHPVRFSDILAKSDHPKATLYRMFQTLTNQGMLSYSEDRQTYALGVRLVRLAHSAWQQSSLAPVARPFLDELSKIAGETVHLAQVDQGQVLYVDKRNATLPVNMFSGAGKIGPGYCTGVGKAMIAFLDKNQQSQAIKQQAFLRYTDTTITTPEAFTKELSVIRTQGVAFDREEHEPTIICIAAPILTQAGRVLGAVSVTSTTQRHSIAGLEAFKPHLLEAARKTGDLAESWQYPE